AGVALCRAFAPELVLCDVGLPGSLSGYDVARALRADGALNDATLVALTGYGRAEDRAFALECGFDEHLTKPVSLDRLRTLIAELPVRRGERQPSPATAPRLS